MLIYCGSTNIVTVLWQEEGYTVKYNLSPRDFQGLYFIVYPDSSNNKDIINFSKWHVQYCPPSHGTYFIWLSIPIYVDTNANQIWRAYQFIDEIYRNLIKREMKARLIVLFWLGNIGKVNFPYCSGSWAFIFLGKSSIHSAELCKYWKILPSWASNTEEFKINFIMF